MRQLFTHRDARLLLLGQFLSQFGDRAMFLVLAVWVKQLTGSNGDAGLVFFLLALPSLAAPLGGLLVDRVRRRPLMISADVVVGATLLLLLFVHGRGQLWLIYAVTFVYGASFVVFGSAQSALLTVMLPEELLADANGALQTSGEAWRLIAPLAGAGLYSLFGGGTVAVIDAATFAASAVCLSLLRVREPRPVPGESHFLAQVTAGVRHITANPGLRRIIVTIGVALLVVGFSETVVLAVIGQGLHRSPTFLGPLLSAQGVGAIAGGLSASAVLRRYGDSVLIGLGVGLFGVGDLGLLGSSLLVVLPGIVVVGVGVSWAVVAFGTAVQLRTPPELQGRVYSAAEMLVGTPQTISIAAGAVLVSFVDYRILVGVMALVTGLCGVYILAASRGDARVGTAAPRRSGLDAPGPVGPLVQPEDQSS